MQEFNNNYIPQELQTETLKQDPRVYLFFEKFLDTKNPETYLKIFQAGEAAGFTSEEANQITSRNWFLSGLPQFRRKKQNDIADNNLDEFLTLPIKTPSFDKLGNYVGDVYNSDTLQAKLKTTLFVKERLDKDNFSQRIDKTETQNFNIFKFIKAVEQGNVKDLIPDVIIHDGNS